MQETQHKFLAFSWDLCERIFGDIFVNQAQTVLDHLKVFDKI